MIAVDTNILVYAHREDSTWHQAAFATVAALAESRVPWAIPWPCLHEFIAVATHVRIYAPPTPLSLALKQVEAWLESPALVVLSEEAGYWNHLRTMLATGKVTGPMVHDARVAALCRQHAVRELWSTDRDFTRFPDIVVRNPLVARG